MTTHICCRYCPFEALVEGVLRAEETVATHENDTSHRVAHECIGHNGTGRLVTDGGRDELPDPEDRPSVDEMALEGLREEYRTVADIAYSTPEGSMRKLDLWYELRDRVDVEQPECPTCGEGNWG